MFGHRNGKGAVVVDGRQVADTLQCVHCGYTWQVQHGSGTRRGFCMGCQGVTCGEHLCMKFCTPLEARIELTEAIHLKRAKDVKKLLDKYPGIAPY